MNGVVVLGATGSVGARAADVLAAHADRFRVEGLAALKNGKVLNYEGASGPCDFTDKGDIADCQFRYEQVKSGKLTLLRIA